MKNNFRRFLVVFLVAALFLNLFATTANAEHVHSPFQCLEVPPRFYPNDSTTHKRFDNTGDVLCECGVVIEEGIISLTYENHDFNSENTCTKCRQHVHKNATCDPGGGTSYEPKDNLNHTKIVVTTNERCYCREIMVPGTTIRKSESHSFDSKNTCTKCKLHVHKGWTCDPGSTTYEQCDSANHYVVSVFGDEHCSCDFVVKEGYTSKTLEAHSLDSKSTCTKCTKHVCKATRTGLETFTYEQSDFSNHIKVINSGDELCICDSVVKEGSKTRVTEPHSFNGNGTCENCNYSIHKHQGVSSGLPSTKYERASESNHIKVYTESDERCSCGKVMVQGNTTRTEEPHTFDSSFKCTACDYTKGHKHEVANVGKSSTTCEPNGPNSHIIVNISGDQVCSCERVLVQGETTRTEEPHEFDSDDKCTICGYVGEHKHKATISELESTTYEIVDLVTHIEVITSGGERCKCGKTMVKSETTRTSEPHIFENDVCTECGYVKKHEHEISRIEKPSIAIEQKDSTYHVLVVYGGYALCSCGKVLYLGDIARIDEKHSYMGDTCSYCGYQSLSGALVQVVEEGVKGNFSDDSSLWGIAGQIGIGELPLVGTIADVRDVFADIINWDGTWGKTGITIIDSAGLLPLLGGPVKYADDIVEVAGKTDEIASILAKTDDVAAVVGKSDEIASILAKYDEVAATVGKSDEIANALAKTDDVATIVEKSDGIDELLSKVELGPTQVVRKSSNLSLFFKNYDAFKRKLGSAGKGLEWHHIVGQTQIKRAGFSSEMVNSTDNIVAIDKETHKAITKYYNKIVEGTDQRYYEWISNQPFDVQYKEGLELLDRALRETKKVK